MAYLPVACDVGCCGISKVHETVWFIKTPAIFHSRAGGAFFA
jgi:hypothetical protein